MDGSTPQEEGGEKKVRSGSPGDTQVVGCGGLTKLEGLKAVLLAEEVDVVGDIQLMQVGEDTLDLESLRLKVVLQKQLEAPKGNMGENNGVHSLEEEERDEEVGSTPFRRKEQERPKKK